MNEFIWDESEWPNLEAARRSLGQEQAVNDQELAASARETARKLFAGYRGDLIRLAAGQLLAMADRLDGPKAAVFAFCKRCEAGTASVPCPRCGGPACAGCGRCPPCDGDIPEGSND